MRRHTNWDNRQILTNAAGISAYYVQYFTSARLENFYHPRRYDYNIDWPHIVRGQALGVVYACEAAACEQITQAIARNRC